MTLQAQGVKGGRNVAVYWDGAIRLEAGVEMVAPFTEQDGVVRSATPGGRVAVVTHLGPYAGLGRAHAAVRQWAKTSGHRVRDMSVEAGHSQLAAYLIGFMALSAAGVGVFAYPHPLHNVFGISELIGYQAPFVLALTWRRDPRARTLVALSWIQFGLIWVAIALNLSSFDRQGAVWAYVKPAYGLAQRALFAAWFGWCVAVGVLLFQRKWQSPVR